MNNDFVSLNTLGNFEHFVQFYRTNDFFLDLLSSYFLEGVAVGDSCIAIATKPRMDCLKSRLEETMDLEKALWTRKILLLDASETLTKFMVRNKPNLKKFNDLIGTTIKVSKLHGRHVRAFGEMVSILWEQGNTQGAISLEKLWNNLGKDNNFSLLCAYELSNFCSETSAHAFHDVCNQHSRVITEPVIGN